MKRVLPAIALAAASTLVSLVAAEPLYRIHLQRRYRAELATFSSDTWQLLPDSPLVFRLPVSHEGRAQLGNSRQTVPYRTNADGFRDAERGAKRPDVPRVLVLGDSYTFAWGVRDEEAYPQRAEALLRQDGREIEVINAGVPGYNTEQEAALLDELFPKYRPDMVALGYVMNDAEPQMTVPASPAFTYRHAWSWMWEDAKELVARHAPGVTRWAPANKLVPSLDYTLGFRPESPKWRDSKAALGRMAVACRRDRVPLLVMILPDFTQRFDGAYRNTMIHEAVAAWSGELGVAVVDLLPRFRNQDHLLFMIPFDGHPNARAHQVIATVLRNEIVTLLQAPPGGVGAENGRDVD